MRGAFGSFASSLTNRLSVWPLRGGCIERCLSVSRGACRSKSGARRFDQSRHSTSSHTGTRATETSFGAVGCQAASGVGVVAGKGHHLRQGDGGMVCLALDHSWVRSTAAPNPTHGDVDGRPPAITRCWCGVSRRWKYRRCAKALPWQSPVNVSRWGSHEPRKRPCRASSGARALWSKGRSA